MKNSTYRFTLDLQKHSSQNSIAVYKYDNAVTLYISLTDGGNPYEIADGSYAIFYGKRSDGKPLIHKCEVNDNTELVYIFRNSTAYVSGVVDCQIRIYDGQNTLITAPKFTIMVEERVIDDDDIEILDNDQLQGVDDIFNNENYRQLKEAERDIAENGVYDQDGNLVTAGRVQAEEAREAAEANRKSVWVRYSSRADGENYTATWREGQKYIGVAASHDEPTDKSQYVWALFKGDKGERGDKGDSGEPFRILKQYTSINQMINDFSNTEVPRGGFVLIDTGTPGADDNGKLYCKGATAWTFITDMDDAIALKGEKGDSGDDGVSVTHTWDGTRLVVTSASGTSSADLKGQAGNPGLSAYQIARAMYGYQTEREWLDSLKGTNGTNGFSAYQIAKANGLTTAESEADWILSLKGADGDSGLSAFQIAKSVYGYQTEEEWLESLKGRNGTNGTDGRSAYQIAKDNGATTAETEAEWVVSLRGTNGTNGDSAFDIACRAHNWADETEWLASLHGTDGDDGDSAFDIACRAHNWADEAEWLASLHGASAYDIAKKNGFDGTEAEWLEYISVKHEWDGTTLKVTSGGETTSANLKGENGLSAYQIARAAQGYETEEEWLESLKGDDGDSAFDIARKHFPYESEEQWLATLYGHAKEIKTTDGNLMRVFVGTNAAYNALPDKDNLLALLTDDPMIQQLNKLLDWYDEEHYVAIQVTSFTSSLSGTYEVGSTISGSAELSWSFNKTPKILTLDGASKSVNSTGVDLPNANYTTNKTWTLVATGDNGETATKTTSITFTNAVYYGVSSSTTYDEALIKSLNKYLVGTHKASFNATAGEGQYIYYCVPDSFSNASFKFNDLAIAGGMSKVATGVQYTNGSSTLGYTIYRSDYTNLGTNTIHVS